MAKRKRLEAPDAKDLEEMEAGFATKPAGDRIGLSAPIAQVAGESAEAHESAAVDDRVVAATQSSDAESWRAALAEGRVIQWIPLSRIHLEHLVRDRMAVGTEELEELKSSIRTNGLRTPVELVALSDGYGLVSGWRRIKAVQALLAEGSLEDDLVKAVVQAGGEAGAAYAAMVEENEVRAELTPYERGRIAVVAAGQGAFPDVETAVAGIYAAASKAKRSKIRSFALVHEELGDLLAFPMSLSEKAGLRLAGAIRNGFAAKLRGALVSGVGVDPDGEWAVLHSVLVEVEASGRESGRGGRPRTSAPSVSEGKVELANGISVERRAEHDGYSLHFRGKVVDRELMDTVVLEIERLLSKE